MARADGAYRVRYDEDNCCSADDTVLVIPCIQAGWTLDAAMSRAHNGVAPDGEGVGDHTVSYDYT